jgi:hypothetical protein
LQSYQSEVQMGAKQVRLLTSQQLLSQQVTRNGSPPWPHPLDDLKQPQAHIVCKSDAKKFDEAEHVLCSA